MTDDQLIREIMRDLTYTFERLAPPSPTGNDWMHLVRLTMLAAMQIATLVIEGQAEKQAQRQQWRWN